MAKIILDDEWMGDPPIASGQASSISGIVDPTPLPMGFLAARSRQARVWPDLWHEPAAGTGH